MKKRMLYWSVVLTAVLFVSACQKQDLYNPDSSKKVTDLIIPEGFDWSLTKDVSLKLVSPVQTNVSVFISEDCSDKSLIAKLPAFEGAKPVELSVPKETVSLYIQYDKSDGTKAVLPVSLNSPVTRASADLEVRLPQGVGESVNGRGQMVFYPSMSERGTLLFEDNWPELGDYDFNDVVANYQITTTGDNDGVSSMDIWVRLSALGGLYTYDLGLMLDGVATDNIASIKKGDEIGEWSQISKGDESYAILFKWENLKGRFGGKYYNTEKQYKVDLIVWNKQTAFFTIEFKNKVKVNNHSFNFFIKSPNSREIHLMGYRPTESFSAAYNKLVEDYSDVLNPDIYYRSDKGLVWGLNIPKSIPHALEGVDFNLAYKKFAGWVMSNGTENQNWYESGEPSKLMPLVDF